MNQITVVRGNITKQVDCDAVVNAANIRLRAGSGVCGAIHKAAGPELEQYCLRHAPIGVGEAIATPAFALGCRYIIHTVGPKYLFDENPPLHLRLAVENSVLLADQLSVKRIALPAISTGVYGYPPDEAVPIMVGAVKALLEGLVSVEEVRFVVLGESMFQLYRQYLTTY